MSCVRQPRKMFFDSELRLASSIYRHSLHGEWWQLEGCCDNTMC